jgi:hypothetical protein
MKHYVVINFEQGQAKRIHELVKTKDVQKLMSEFPFEKHELLPLGIGFSDTGLLYLLPEQFLYGFSKHSGEDETSQLNKVCFIITE